MFLLLVPPVDPAVEVRALLDRQVADWNRKDLDGFLAGYWDSPDVVFQSGGDRTRGFAAMRDRYRKNYQAEGKEMGTLTFTDLEFEIPRPQCRSGPRTVGRWSSPTARTPPASSLSS